MSAKKLHCTLSAVLGKVATSSDSGPEFPQIILQTKTPLTNAALSARQETQINHCNNTPNKTLDMLSVTGSSILRAFTMRHILEGFVWSNDNHGNDARQFCLLEKIGLCKCTAPVQSATDPAAP